MDFLNPLSDSIETLSTVVADKGPGGLGSCWEGGCDFCVFICLREDASFVTAPLVGLSCTSRN